MLGKPSAQRAAGEDLFQVALDPHQMVALDDLQFRVAGMPGVSDFVWHYAHRAYVALNKPAGFECSHKPSAWPSIDSLLPSALRLRPQKSAIQGVQAIGRLDQDTTGLLILTDDGALIHRVSSPKHHAPKVYEVGLKHPITQQQVDQLLQGVVLDDSPKPVRAAACRVIEMSSERPSDESSPAAAGAARLALTLTEGKYHQVKRMVAAVGNRVVTLHRSQIGAFKLPEDLAPGAWRWLTPSEVASLEALAE